MEQTKKDVGIRILLGGIALIGLALVFIFQQTDIVFLLTHNRSNPELHFAINRMARIFFNDLFMLLFLYTIFADKQVLRFAIGIQLIDLFVLFPIYLIIKLSIEGDSEISSPFLSQFHRLIVNPTLMILIIPAVYYQKFILQKP
jgi:exosortase F-associated protein